MSTPVVYIVVATQDDEAPVKAGFLKRVLRTLAEGK
jgi:hypothetical protein